MADDTLANLNNELQQTIGAAKILDILREEFGQWLEEAQDESKQEALENVLGHIEAMENEYKHRAAEAKKQLGD
jgi:hypothetical protein